MKDNETEGKKPMVKKKDEPVEVTAQPMIYIGPGFRDSDLSTYKVFAEGIPDEFKDNPIYAPLFVSPENLDACRIEVGEAGTRLNVLYQKAVQEHDAKERR